MRCEVERRRRLLLLPALSGLSLALIGLAGCGGEEGPPRSRVHGQVTYDGKPLEKGTIEFAPIEGTAGESAQGEIKDGQYDVPRATGPLQKGRYQVIITALRPTGKAAPPDPFEGTLPTPLNLQPMENYIPAQYNRRTNLRAAISEDTSKNQFDFELEKGAAATTKKRR
jgi:hypothetical protein